MLALLRELDEADWGRPTDCAGWTVRDVIAHVTGAADESAHLRVQLRHMRAARRAGGPSLVDQLNVLQIADRQGAHAGQMRDELARLAPKAVRARRRAPSLVRKRQVPGADLPDGSTFGYLFDVVYSRDVWMHRIDIARACGRGLPPADSDARVVEQVVRDLGRHWSGPSLALHLTGAGGGSWLLGTGRPVAEAEVDTVEYLRILSGRRGEPQLTIAGVPTVRDPLLSARVVF